MSRNGSRRTELVIRDRTLPETVDSVRDNNDDMVASFNHRFNRGERFKLILLKYLRLLLSIPVLNQPAMMVNG